MKKSKNISLFLVPKRLVIGTDDCVVSPVPLKTLADNLVQVEAVADVLDNELVDVETEVPMLLLTCRGGRGGGRRGRMWTVKHLAGGKRVSLVDQLHRGLKKITRRSFDKTALD